MGEKIYKPILNDDEHLLRSSENPNRVRELSRDENNENPDIPEWEEVNLDELKDYSSNPTSDSVGEGVAIAMLVGTGIAIGIGVSKAYPHVKKWVTETVAPKAKHLWHKVHGESNKVEISQTNVSILEMDCESSDSTALSMDTAFNEYKENISSEEAQRELLEAFILYLASAQKVRRVANANVINIAGEIVDRKFLIEVFNNDELIDSINEIIRSNPKLLSEQQLNMLSETIGYKIFDGEEMLPISCKALAEGLKLSIEKEQE
ncbi:hypothetical protein MCC02031_16370 [Bifidobacteriaceae bacterium MCC02031]|nr:hypothetical protein MCC02031_16370 [Bifidobacteriaceae bacterium MCC02031]